MMLDLLQFIFSSFWVFAGTVILLTLIVSPLYAFAATLGAVLGIGKRDR